MNPDVFLENFELLADAPNGVQKLRELILQLAVMGKLVPQDPNGEPASELLERINAEKKKLVREKVIRADSFARIEENEILFKIPKRWEWVRLGQIGDWGAGSTPSRRNSDYFGGTIKWFKSGELNDGYITDSEEKITDLALNDCSLRLNKKGDVLIAMYGATIGKVAILDTEATTNQAVCACTCFTEVYNRYLFFLLKAYRPYFTSQGAGGAQPNISRIKIVNTVVPLPPLDEQKRIVSKVDELMALCDKLETRRQKKQEIQSKLNSTALDRMLSAENQDEFEQHWQHICENFDLLYDNPENVEKLRQAILQLAVQGKLVPQNPEDEPASVLIEKIKVKKKDITGKIEDKSKSLQIVENKRLSLPSSWILVKLGDLIYSVVGGGTPSKRNPDYWEGDIPWASVKDLGKGKYLEHTVDKITELGLKQSSTNLIPIGRVIVCTRMGLGKIVINKIDVAINQDLKALHLLDEVDLNYFYDFYLTQNITGSGMTVKGIRQGDLLNILVPLPPLAEQKRIVEKVEQLMGLCDELEAKLRKEQEDSEKLMEAVVKGLLEGANTGKTELEKPIPLQVATIKLK